MLADPSKGLAGGSEIHPIGSKTNTALPTTPDEINATVRAETKIETRKPNLKNWGKNNEKDSRRQDAIRERERDVAKEFFFVAGGYLLEWESMKKEV